MDLFEILFIALFILFPIVEQVLKKKRAPGPQQQEPEDRPLEDEVPDRLERPGRGDGPASQDPGSASDMVPDDLWAVLTGERREPRVEEAPGSEPSGWDEEQSPAWGEARRDEKRRWARQNAPWSIDDDQGAPPDQAATPVPESLEEYGPEAYSLERLDLEPESLEQPLPSAEARHRQFHELIDRPPRKRKARRSRVSRALREPASLRQALILNEVLGTPKGLD